MSSLTRRSHQKAETVAPEHGQVTGNQTSNVIVEHTAEQEDTEKDVSELKNPHDPETPDSCQSKPCYELHKNAASYAVDLPE